MGKSTREINPNTFGNMAHPTRVCNMHLITDSVNYRRTAFGKITFSEDPL